MSFHVRTDSPHGRRASHRRLAIERCEERIALSTTSAAATESVALSDPTVQGFYLSGASFALLNARGQVVATAQFDRVSETMVFDYTSGDSFRLSGESLWLNGAGLPVWMGEDAWRTIPPPEELPGAAGAMLPLPLNAPDPGLPVAGSAATEPQMFTGTSTEQGTLMRSAVESSDLGDQPSAAIQPQHDRPRNSAVFFEVAATSASHTEQTALPQPNDRVELRNNARAVPQVGSASHSAKLMPHKKITGIVSSQPVVGSAADRMGAESTEAEPPAVFRAAPPKRGAQTSDHLLAEPAGGDGADQARHDAFAAWEVQEGGTPLVSASRSHYPELLAVAIAVMAARDRQLATKKTSSTSAISPCSWPHRVPEDGTEP